VDEDDNGTAARVVAFLLPLCVGSQKGLPESIGDVSPPIGLKEVLMEFFLEEL